MTSKDATTTALPQQVQLELLREMVEIRAFEDACHRLFAQGLVRGSTHLGQGQEAVAVGACRALTEGDTMTCTYRGHAATLAMGAPLDRSFGEILGKAEGLCGGKGGSMHLTDVSVGAMGSFAIVGAHLPIATGLAFASRYRGGQEVSLCFFGDGSTNIGAFHESLNLASIWKLPVVFVCENNLYGEYSPIATTTPIPNLADRADAYVFVVPEYNYGMPPALLNALDYVYYEWHYKAVGFVSYGGISGGLRSVQMAKPVITTLRMMPIPEAVSVPFYAKLVTDGTFAPGESAERSATAMLDELLKWTGALAPLRG